MWIMIFMNFATICHSIIAAAAQAATWPNLTYNPLKVRLRPRQVLSSVVVKITDPSRFSGR